MAQALRYLSEGIAKAMAVLEESTPADKQAALLKALLDFTPAGVPIRTDDLSKLFREHGYDARSIGSFVRQGYLVADPRNPNRAPRERTYFVMPPGARRRVS